MNTDDIHPLIEKVAQMTVQREIGPLVERIAQFIEHWGGSPPRPGGGRAALANDIRREFGVTVAVEPADVHADLIVAADHLHESQ